MTRFTPSQLSQMANNLRYSGTDSFSDDAAEMLEQAAEDAERLARIADDPTGFSVAGILDEAKNWTSRATGKQMLLNYAAALDTARRTQEKKA